MTNGVRKTNKVRNITNISIHIFQSGICIAYRNRYTHYFNEFGIDDTLLVRIEILYRVAHKSIDKICNQ